MINRRLADLRARWPSGNWRNALVFAAIWCIAGLVLFAFDAYLDLSQKALVMVLVSASAALVASPRAAMLASAMAVLAFNFFFVPPRGTLWIDLREHGLLLLTMLAVSWVVALLMARQRQLVLEERRHARESEQLRQLGESLREHDDAASQLPAFMAMLGSLHGPAVSVLLLARGVNPEPLLPAGSASDVQAADKSPETELIGQASSDEYAGLVISARENKPLGPGTGRHEDQPAWFLPLRGRKANFGAALIPLGGDTAPAATETARIADAALLRHAQALCDQMGMALERGAALTSAALAREETRHQALRTTLLAAISHDHRTPLATLLGAASALHDQAGRLSVDQQRRLAATIVDEARQLTHLTENILQLARLDAAASGITRDWESATELVESAIRHIPLSDGQQRINARIDADVPLVWCNAVLVNQLLGNLLDNALKYSGPDTPVDIHVRNDHADVLFAIRDRGPGVPPALQERIFDAFQRGAARADAHAESTPRSLPTSQRGAGVGLTLCRVIARAHGGTLVYHTRRQGGASFEFRLPRVAPPSAAVEKDLA